MAEAAAQRQWDAVPGADPRNLALLLAPDRLKGALVSLVAALQEIMNRPDTAGDVVDEVATVLDHRLTRDEIGVLLAVLAAAADPADLAALAENVNRSS